MDKAGNIRYGYFDAMRGVAILLIVIHHVIYFSIDIQGGINIFLVSFFRQLFFFISGFFAYKAMHAWSRRQIRDVLTRRFKVLVIGGSVFLCLYTIFIERRLPGYHVFLDPSKYWFTFVLFRVVFGYIAIVMISKLFREEKRVFRGLMLISVIGCILIYANYDEIIDKLSWSDSSRAIWYLLIYKQAVSFYPYFAFGIIARAKMDSFRKMLSNDGAKAASVVTLAVIWILTGLDYVRIPINSILFTIRCLITILLLTQLFYTYRQEFDRETVVSKWLRFIGQRTLDIYFIHYFFLPDLGFLKPYLDTGDWAFMQWMVSFFVSMMIVGLSLLIGQIIRMSPLLTEWTLQAKSTKK